MAVEVPTAGVVSAGEVAGVVRTPADVEATAVSLETGVVSTAGLVSALVAGTDEEVKTPAEVDEAIGVVSVSAGDVAGLVSVVAGTDVVTPADVVATEVDAAAVGVSVSVTGQTVVVTGTLMVVRTVV